MLLTAIYPAYVSGPTSPMSGIELCLENVAMASSVNFSSKTLLPSSKSLYKMMPGCLTPSAFARSASFVAPKRNESRRFSAALVKVSFDALSLASKKPTSTTWSAVVKSGREFLSRTDTAGRACFVMYDIILCHVSTAYIEGNE